MATIRSTVLLCLGFITIVVAMFVISVTRTPQLSDEELRAAIAATGASSGTASGTSTSYANFGAGRAAKPSRTSRRACFSEGIIDDVVASSGRSLPCNGRPSRYTSPTLTPNPTFSPLFSPCDRSPREARKNFGFLRAHNARFIEKTRSHAQIASQFVKAQKTLCTRLERRM